MIATCYLLKETTSSNYLQRTEWNVRDSDATVIFSILSTLSGGSKRTVEFAKKHHKPWIHVSQEEDGPQATKKLKHFIKENHIRKLNVAGPRASKEPTICNFVAEVLNAVI